MSRGNNQRPDLQERAKRTQARVDGIIQRLDERNAKEREEQGVCGCGHPLDQCAPENCCHPFAQDAMWGGT